MIEAQAYMSFHSFDCEVVPAAVSISRFQGPSGVDEYHLIVRPTEHGSITTQLGWVLSAYQRALGFMGLDPGTSLLRRFFCSDLPNQAIGLEAYPFANPHTASAAPLRSAANHHTASAAPLRSATNPHTASAAPLRSATEASDELCAVSWVGQPPAPPAKVALWAYHVSDCVGALDKTKEGTSLSLRRGDLTHLWTTGVTCPDKDTSYDQTKGIFERYEGYLRARELRLAEHLIRTWFFVQNVEADYQGLVAARRDIFAKRGLTPETHFIASTGIEGTSADLSAKVMMDAYAISGVRSDQVEFLSAPEHLSPTHIYGVTFERGVSVAYRDRRHVTISGTASIDHAGKIVHPGDVLGQLDRTVKNVEALLQQAGATFQDVCSFIVYVRDPSDLGVAQRVMCERFGPAPVQVVVAPICRPGWLVEIECQAIVPALSPALPPF